MPGNGGRSKKFCCKMLAALQDIRRDAGMDFFFAAVALLDCVYFSREAARRAGSPRLPAL